MAPAAGDRSLKETPTWAVAVVCAVFVIISILIEHGIHSLGNWFQKRHKKAMIEALEKIKAELMLLGFISLLITVGTEPISMICMPKNFAKTMLPCGKDDGTKDSDDSKDADLSKDRKLLWYNEDVPWRRFLAPEEKTDHCSKHVKKTFSGLIPSADWFIRPFIAALLMEIDSFNLMIVLKYGSIVFQDQVPLISQSGVHQLHIFIFVLAVFHVLYSVLLIALAKAKMKKWEAWERETTSLEYQFNNDPSRFRLTHQTSFIRRHSGLSTTPGLRWTFIKKSECLQVAFFRQFFASVTKVDYMTMRRGFINILLLVGAKLEIIIMEMAQQIQEKTTVVKGAPIVETSNKYFWFNRPGFILFLIHFTLFQYEFGLRSCFHKRFYEILTRVCLGVAVQILCSYITFPLYALVTQMGSHMKKAIFEEQTAKALKNWHKAAKERKKLRKQEEKQNNNGEYPSSPTPSFMSGENSLSIGSSPLHLLHKYKHNSSDWPQESGLSSPRSYYSETELSEGEVGAPTAFSNNNDSVGHHDHRQNGNEIHSCDFSFAQP
ncbi:hypothetical protein CDL15_Pgr004819 [Punica granatum]|uniref:MLO-like protein n=1 Tax=Punica granatum TaxID=22663 RepID=A0A218W638_PUNGR|nr:hypothetical protein CDL15_Pgr004819 [Punica granatum]